MGTYSSISFIFKGFSVPTSVPSWGHNLACANPENSNKTSKCKSYDRFTPCPHFCPQLCITFGIKIIIL